MGAAEKQDTLVVTLTQEQLASLVERAVAKAMGNANATREYLDTAGVCEWLGLDPKTVNKYVNTEGMPALKVGPRNYRFRRESVIEWLESRATKPGAHVAKHAARLQKAKLGG